MSRPMTSEEQAIADKIGLNVNVRIDQDQGFNFRPGIAVEYVLRQGVTLPPGMTLEEGLEKAADMLKPWLAESLARDAAKISDRATDA